jgi:multiple RNA-binding domain-containing protein 1
MSRLLVKNLPSYVTPARLKEHFEQKKGPGGTLTDVKVAHKRDGTSRRFGFIGFKTEKEANAAKEWFDRTFLDSSRISVAIVEACFSCFSPYFIMMACY